MRLCKEIKKKKHTGKCIAHDIALGTRKLASSKNVTVRHKEKMQKYLFKSLQKPR